jgi:hypothetical protein
MSHEISESFNDPFLNNATRVWQIRQPNRHSTDCQGNLETADPVEVLSNAVFPMTYTEGRRNQDIPPADRSATAVVRDGRPLERDRWRAQLSERNSTHRIGCALSITGLDDAILEDAGDTHSSVLFEK